jgi:hypothetical protein
VIGALREKRIGWIRIAWSGRVHRFLFYLSNARQTRNGCLSFCSRFAARNATLT